jgi:RHH-type transcriptional regulator, proline utilization regulon repressor / proline dehydrogenase / delta 1-pyrroline-5-carboxylate dehydrogenase
MEIADLESQIIARGKEFFAGIRGEEPSLFNKARWTGKMMDWCMKNEDFKVQLFRFVDVYPYLTTGRLLTNHIGEYFNADGMEIPSALKWGAKAAGLGGSIGGKILDAAIRFNIEDMAKQFIVGQDTKSAIKNIGRLREQSFAFVVDVLGEATLNEEEAEKYVATYIDLLENLKIEQNNWPPLGTGNNSSLDWGHTPKINIAVKPTAFYSQARPADFEGSVQHILERMKKIYRKIIEVNGFLCIDMESYKYKDITLEVFRRLRSDAEFNSYPHLGIAMQAYLRDNDRDIEELIEWAKAKKLPVSIRLVKGAYWDYETVIARQNGWDIPIYTIKSDTDAAYERQAKKILENHSLCHLACASHNIRTISAVMEMARALNVPQNRCEFQVLYGMAEPVRKGLQKIAGRIRLYCPYGRLVPGMAYLVRRLLENTSNESFLRQSFVDQKQLETLLENPAKKSERSPAKSAPVPAQPPEGNSPPFRNEPLVDFTKEYHRLAFPKAIADVRSHAGRTYPLFINNKEVWTDDRIPSVNPAKPSEVIGQICQAGTREVNMAVAAAKAAYENWRDIPFQKRAQYLLKAADIARRRLHELSAWQILEVGKQWEQAYADVAECIDFFEYYAREMIRLGKPRRVGSAPGEINLYYYEPKGVAAVIAPWNFPLAISGGMCAAAIVTGNCVVYKPSVFASTVGYNLVEIFSQAGLPEGVFNYIPGRGFVIGDYLVEHPDISLIAFTGSVEIGNRIIEKAAKIQSGQPNVKKIISEMGGKNAIIIDDDADLDEAVPHVLYSAFGFQGQKCSACSRVIVLDAVYEKFVERLVKAASAFKIGPAEDAANAMGTVVDISAQKKILEYVEIGKKEGKLLYQSNVPQDDGYYVPITIFDGITPQCRLAQEEIFGPVLAIMRAKDFDQALDWAMSTRFALTGGVFSRSPKHLEQARKKFRVGNLYLNRNCVGALVERQPFGGSKMSGVGTKAGGPDYILHFMDPRTVTENTMRRGFTPTEKDNTPLD